MQYPGIFVKHRAVISPKKPIKLLQVAKGFTALEGFLRIPYRNSIFQTE